MEHASTSSFVIGIAGASGSGKTTLAERILARIGAAEALRLPHDAYYRELTDEELEDPLRINFDHPSALDTALWAEHLRTLKSGGDIRQPVYDFARHRRKVETHEIASRPVILMEGILVLAETALRAEMDLKIFVDTDPERCLLRRIDRDVSERGRTLASVREQYLATVKPMFEEFVLPSRRHADLIVPYDFLNPTAENVIVSYVLQWKRRG
jgi:uridine kinase